MGSITFFLRRSTKAGNNSGSLCLRIIHRRKIRTQTLPFQLYSNEWDSHHERIVCSTEESSRNRYLLKAKESMESEQKILQQIIETLEEQGCYTVEEVMDHYHLSSKSDHLLCYTEKLALSLIRAGQERTARAYRTVTRGLVAFNKDRDIPLRHINACLIKDFENEMKAKGKTLNTISFYMRNLRAIYNKAIAEKYIEAKSHKPFGQVYTAIHKTQKRALDMEELQQLNNLDFSSQIAGDTSGKNRKQQLTEKLSRAKRLFFFCFHARGMSFVDLAYLRKENIYKGAIRYYRKKTRGLIELQINAAMQEIIDSFACEVIGSPYVFPIIKDGKKSLRLQYESSLRMQNSQLKKLASLALIDKNLTTHVARHSWATIAKRENLPLWVISEGLGHSSEKMTYTYLASLDQNIINRASELISKAVVGCTYSEKAS